MTLIIAITGMFILVYTIICFMKSHLGSCPWPGKSLLLSLVAIRYFTMSDHRTHDYVKLMNGHTNSSNWLLFP
jgi:uncharacterized membrane protein YczE